MAETPPIDEEKRVANFLNLHERGQNIVVGLALIFFLFILSLKFTSVFERFNHSFTDFQIGLLPQRELSRLPVIVEVDEKSLAAYGQWPWPRFQVAKLLEAIKVSGVNAIGIDALFVEPDRTSPAIIQHDLKANFKNQLGNFSDKADLPDYDAILGKTIDEGPFVLSYMFSFDDLTKNPCTPHSANGHWQAKDGSENSTQLFQANNIVCNIAPIQSGAKYSGFINSAPDDDGLYRRTPLIIKYLDKIYPSLALQTYLAAISENSFSVTVDDAGLMLKIGQLSVPLDAAGNLLLKLPTGNLQFQKISASDFLTGLIPANALKDRIAFIGFSATGLHEFRPTPYMPQFLGIEIHASIIDNFDRKDFLERPANSLWFELLLASILSIALMIGLTHAKPITSAVAPLLLIVILAASSQLLLRHTGLVISPAFPIAMILLTLLALSLMKYRREYLHADEMTKLVAQTQEGIIESFCSMCEYRDPETGAHIKRTQNYIKALALHLQKHPKFKHTLTPETIELFYKAAPLHDIGKIGIRDHILLKPGSLADDELTIMKSHPIIGAEIIKSVASQIGWNPFMQVAHQISLYHQEKWDGSGYPFGLVGEAIPLSARFMALADVYDALISKRVYKPAFSHNMAVAIIKKTKDIHFDPLLAEAFEEIHEEFRDIALQFLDDEDQRNTLLAIYEP